MTGYLARVAARTVGEAASARPRLPDAPGLHEPALPAGLETLDVEAAPPARADQPRREPGRPEPPRRRTRGPAVALAVPADARGTPDHTVASPESPSPETPDGPATSEPSRKAPPPPVVALVSADPPAARDPVPSRATTPGPIARAAPVAPAPAARGATATAVASRDEEPRVRVHIGRLEVRATLEQPAPERRQPGEPRAPELSLSDYLRGRRGR